MIMFAKLADDLGMLDELWANTVLLLGATASPAPVLPG